MLTFLRVAMARLRAVLRSRELDRDFDQELATHLAMAEEEMIRRGMTPGQARRSARLQLGGLTQLREAGRDARGLPWLGASWLDLKLGLRMLRKSWGLTLVGGLAMTVVIAIAASVFSFLHAIFGSSLPLDEGDRIVALMSYDAAAPRPKHPSLHDFARWRDELRLVEEIGAFRTIERRLVIEGDSEEPASTDGAAEPVSVAQITASGFRLTRVPPLMGRPLVGDDERKGGPAVVVIGHEVWRTRFASDPAVVGRRIRLGDMVHSVVGVMPKGYAFPVNHSYWTPLRADPADYAQGEGPEVTTFARLAAGVTLEGATAELATIGPLPSPTATETHQRLHPRVVPYTLALAGPDDPLDRWVFWLVVSVVTLLLVPPCANIAILVYARTVTRQEELATRFVLGASRRRIVVQLFVETLVLAAGSAGAALVFARPALRQLEILQTSTDLGLPFWMDISLSPSTVLYVAGLAALAAVIAGAVPALQATGHRRQSGFHALGRQASMRLGVTWSALIVVQVALSVAVLPSAVELAWGALRPGILGPGFAAEEFLTARLLMEPTGSSSAGSEPTPLTSRFADLQAQLIQQLEAEPDISAVTVAAALPGGEPWAGIEVGELEGPAPAAGLAPDRPSYFGARYNGVAGSFFDVFEVPVLIGRGFGPEDLGPGEAAVIVNRTLAQEIAGDGNPLGHRVRFVRTNTGPAAESEPWYEIVGVVADLPANTGERKVYRAMAPGQARSVSLALRVGPTPRAGLAGRLREITAALDPTLRMEDFRPLDEVYRASQTGPRIFAFALSGATLSIIVLSAAGMYALMSFTVNRRRREIGLRSALGAQPGRLLASIFKRALGQVASGAVIGLLVALLLRRYLVLDAMGSLEIPGVLPATALFMMVIGVLAAAEPARRGLRIDPIEELREG